MTERKFDIAGFSTLHGNRKVRFANGKVEARTKVLERNDHIDVDLRSLPYPMTKVEAMAFLGVKDTDPEAPKGVQAAAAKDAKLKDIKVARATEAPPAPAVPAEDAVSA
jgi:hypothetical protein